MFVLVSALIVAGAVLWAGVSISRALAERGPNRVPAADLLALFAPGVAAAVDDPRALLAWQPLAVAARRLYPADFADLDRAVGSSFPFSVAQIEAAHARWSAEWLTWERNHDAEYKLKALTLEYELGDSATDPYGRARRDALEREKLDRYQRRYEEYTRTAKALQVLVKQ